MIRIAKKALVLVEWNCELQNKDPYSLGVYQFGHWVRNYIGLLREFVPKDKIRLTKIPKKIWGGKGWGELGYIIEAII